uniref:Btz domain-containing protein n=1 Tax=Rhinopithecus bieti TaxID=61621 RepID=A0A2K6JTF5_RHIBE
MVCSNSRSHSSRSESGSQSRSHSKRSDAVLDHMYSRDYHRRGKQYYQGGGGRYHRGGYRPVWNRRHSRSLQDHPLLVLHPHIANLLFLKDKTRVSGKQTKKAEGEPQEESPLKSKSQEEPKDTFEHDPSEFIDEFNKSSVTSDDVWPGLSAYDNSPRSPHSPSPIATPPSQSSSCSDPPMLTFTFHSNSPINHIPSRRSPAKTIAPQNFPRDESGTGKFLKRFTDEESRVFLLDRGNTSDKEASKETGSEKRRAEGEWEDQEALDYFTDKESGKQKFNDSEGVDIEQTEDYRQFRKSVLTDQGKSFATASHWNTEEEGLKYKSKVSLKGNRENDAFREEKNCILKQTGYVAERPSTTKDKHKEEDKNSERITVKKETQSPEQVKSEKLEDHFDYSPPLHKNLDSTFREENPLRIKMMASDCHHPEFRLKMACVPLDDSNRPASLTKDRLLASTLVHSLPQASNSTSESFIQHIVSLVHHVEEQYFKLAAMTLNDWFTSTQQKSPEIHRRIDISPSTLRKHTRLAGEERVFKEENQKGDKKLRCDSADFWHDIDRHRKERSKEQGDSKGFRESSESQKQEKTPKDYKEYKSYKDERKHKSREQDHSRSSSSSASPSSPSSREEKESKKEREEKFKTHHEMEEYSGFGGISRGRARGVFAGTNTGPNNSNTTIQKRLKEEEWDPEYTPKSKKYFLHDDRDDGVDYWAKRRKGRSTFQCGRGRFNFKKSGSSPKWTHDRYKRDGIVGDKEETVENNEEKKDRCKEEKE